MTTPNFVSKVLQTDPNIGRGIKVPIGKFRPGQPVRYSGKLITGDALVGAYYGSGDQQSDQDACTAREKLLNRPIDYVTVFGDTNTISSDTFMMQGGFWPDRNMVISIPLCAPGTNMSTITGPQLTEMTNAVLNLVPYADRIVAVRIGWEMNLPGNYPWCAGGNGSNQTPANYITYFSTFADLFRRYLPQVLICWCPNFDRAGFAWYPGDYYVDVVGVDCYLNSAYFADDWYGVCYLPGGSSGSLSTGYGLYWLESLAQQRGKHMALPEWATNYNTGKFITSMSNWINKPRSVGSVLFHGYWDSAVAFDGLLTNYPVNLGAYQSAFADSAGLHP